MKMVAAHRSLSGSVNGQSKLNRRQALSGKEAGKCAELTNGKSSPLNKLPVNSEKFLSPNDKPARLEGQAGLLIVDGLRRLRS